ncbi:STAS domain-containing protein [Cellulomonas edaphi]|uniref:STAS domain-containing protein n=1 Tax=Cellulomonas edaphi TaxID=3053468 RepID=A0ABT7S452_9CELL|nr:STAS domain-containing protein [Cellulomons edaphi]MDM7830390.1 STAS domain-containing protein [Cellulomons edaphi]
MNDTSAVPTPCSGIRATASDAELLVTFAGELDMSLADHFAPLPALVEARGLPLAVDLSEVTFFGAWAADALVALRAAAPAGAFSVRGANEAVRRTLEACGLAAASKVNILHV